MQCQNQNRQISKRKRTYAAQFSMGMSRCRTMSLLLAEILKINMQIEDQYDFIIQAV